jgi:tetratricopeptide (TPR) repeat protein
MSENATNTPKHTMDCARVAREEILETYLAGRLTEQDREAFEEHYFECTRCFDELRTLQTIRDVLPTVTRQVENGTARTFTPWFPVLGLAAAAAFAVGTALFIRQQPASAPPVSTKATSPQETPVPERPTPQQPAQTTASEPSLEQLARVEPPRYEPLKLRGAADEATARFQRGMERYGKADYAGAVDNLRAAADLDPDGIHILFFLGISHLMMGQDDAAIDRLRATIARGDSAYLEEAHWYLAKAFLRRKDLGAAESQLKTLIQLRGPKRGEARELLSQVEKIKNRTD